MRLHCLNGEDETSAKDALYENDQSFFSVSIGIIVSLRRYNSGLQRLGQAHTRGRLRIDISTWLDGAQFGVANVTEKMLPHTERPLKLKSTEARWAAR